MRNGVTERDLGWNRIKRETKALGGKSVDVGLQNDGTMGKDCETLVSQYAYYNEYGTGRIPSRPFMRNAFDQNKADILRTTRKLWDGVMTGRLDANQAAGVLGQSHVDHIIGQIESGDFEKNAESTIARKSTSAGVGDSPLEDTGQMKQSVRHVVKG